MLEREREGGRECNSAPAWLLPPEHKQIQLCIYRAALGR